MAMEKGGKLDRWILKALGANPDTGAPSSRSPEVTYEELLQQEEEHRQALEQDLLDRKAERERIAADAQLQRDLARMEAEALARDYQEQRNIEMIAEMRRQNSDFASFSNNGASFSFTRNQAQNGNASGDIQCQECLKSTAIATFCSHCGQRLE